MNLISKIALKSIGVQPKLGEKPEKETDLAALYGRVQRYEVGQTTYGEFTKFRGSFEATNYETGEVYRSGAILVPRVIEDMLRDAVDSSEGSAVDFAIVVGIKPVENNFGYEYTVKPLVEIKESDELANLRQLALKALPAPAAEKEKGKGKK